MGCPAAVAAAANYSDEVQTATTATTKNKAAQVLEQHHVKCISVIYNTFVYAYIPHTYPTVN